MATIQELHTQSLLAQAAYADLTVGIPSVSALRAENKSNMTLDQATDFASKWTVIDQYIDASGAAATVFQEITTGKKYLAIRGTTPTDVGDLNADYILALGFPSFLSPQFIQLLGVIQNWIDNGKLGNGFTITGHSLGGYIATALGSWFSNQAASVYTYNAPGLGGVTGNVLDLFRTAFGLGNTSLISNLNNIRGTAGVSLIARVGVQLSPPVMVETEIKVNPFDNHSILNVTDSLAVYKLLAQLAPSVTLAQLKTMFEKTSNFANRSLEAMVEALAQTITGHKPIIATDNRDALYQAINDLLAVDANGQLTGSFASLAGLVTLVNPPTSAAQARADFGAFLSLINLSPFAIKTTTPEAATALQAANASLSAAWQADNALNATQRANGEANYSDLYLADRAAMLSWLNKRNTADQSDYGLSPNAQDSLFYDKATSTSLNLGSISASFDARRRFMFGSDSVGDSFTGGNKDDHLYGMAGADELNGGAGNDHLEGGADADKLNGGEGLDMLYGGKGDDELTGGAGTGTDYLYGGEGDDTYIHADGDGTDVITDSDGLGKIQIAAGTILNGATSKKSSNYWYNAEQETGYAIYHGANGIDTLNIYLKNGEKLFVNNWVDGKLGISLSGAAATANVVLTNDSNYREANAADDKIDGGAGNDVLRVLTNQEVTLWGGAGDDLILGYGNGFGGAVSSSGLFTPEGWQVSQGSWQLTTDHGTTGVQ